MKFIFVKIFVLFFLCSVQAFADSWKPIDGHTQVLIWPSEVPDAQPLEGAEDQTSKVDKLVAGKPWYAVTNVWRPTYTIYSPKENKTDAAVVVFPGGGYKVLAIDLEGTEVCEWLTSKGITCVLLKYRVPYSGCYWDKKCNCNKTPKAFTALQDAQRTLGLIRTNAAKLGINPKKIGVLGFSAGGNLVAMVSSHFSKRSYPRVDEADDASSRPDFAIALYPGHMTLAHKNNSNKGHSQLNPDIPFTSETPPTFLLHSRDDKTNPVKYTLVYAKALEKLSVPVEVHLFEKGGHAFGLRPTGLPISKWPSLVEGWLVKIKILEK